MSRKVSKVYIVGAGPGDRSLLTLKAFRLIKKAEVMIYDYLISPDIIRLAKKGCILVSHERGSTSLERVETFKKTVLEYYDKKSTIVRLHTGDPMLFGMGNEEVSFLREHGITYEVVPGITSALGVPASVGLPITSRGISSSAVIFNGHPINQNEINWDSLAKMDGTLIALMGVSGADQISKNLIGAGLDRLTPVCIISNGTLKTQKVSFGVLYELKALIDRDCIRAPAVIVIGKVARSLNA
ncbi:MAG: uroporphyrinogen-III C-methyltransferase [Nitrososphaerota archaeon]|jgi:uroporphyrin-III C-methyltransferase|nr:uroporphyrinogen-III C-methyltransferase [Nitrososphaerota archaeon]MDG6931668.1 uroporphyrinogen-III C-methyltransferase [Nitrososphaerota archaeon]MDG6936257.1 uroporphyrinogen-III C-methyltransferase [Nitrososphaerota archaeon]MDG6944151.1 uroporphyrinogen-III C-methyltransferase [Nitrososphaerota archaeon]